MSLFAWPKWQRLASGFHKVGERFSARSRRGATQASRRRLLFDPLEERTLLSVSVNQLDDGLVNQYNSGAQSTISAQSVAVDDDGDFVVVWTRIDDVVDEFGDPIVDPETGDYMTDANIYARYFTDEVQQITLPEAVALDNDADASTFGEFTLTYGGNEVQELLFSATYQPFLTEGFQEPLIGEITLTFDGATTDPFLYYDPLFVDIDEQAADIQERLRDDIGGALADVEVRAIDGYTFEIYFGDASGGVDQPEITLGSADWFSGFMPSVDVTTTREPIDLDPIKVSTTNPWSTATAIEEAFFKTSETLPTAPVDFWWPDIVPPAGSYVFPDNFRTALPEVAVTPAMEADGSYSLTEFYVTFVDDSGKLDQPELVIASVADDTGGSLDASPEIDVRTIKQSTDEFRVNPPEPDDPVTELPDVYNQVAPAVAMDIDGDFVITWQGEVPDSENYGSVSDVFARRFSPVGVVDESDIEFQVDVDLDGTLEAIQGVEPLGGAFVVNTFTTNAQGAPAIGMDADGNFVITWSNAAQDVSFFNGIKAQQFNRDGEKIGSEWLVNEEDTDPHGDSYVGVSSDGYFTVAWTLSGAVQLEVYDPEASVLVDQFVLTGGGAASVAWDEGHNFFVGWDLAGSDSDNIGTTSGGVFLTEFSLEFDTDGDFNQLQLIRNAIRGNSADIDADTDVLWPLGQSGNQVVVDADGDVTLSYDGFGPDVSENTVIDGAWYLDALLKQDENGVYVNQDLWAYFIPGSGLPYGFYNGGDIDAEIDEVLFGAVLNGATDEQVGRLRAILDDVATLMRGEANGVMYSQFDADPELGPENILASDNIINSQRDGHNQRYFLALDGDPTVEWNSFTLALAHPSVAGSESVTVNVVTYADGSINASATAINIQAALEGLTRTGENWPEPLYEGGVDVRIVSTEEMEDRANAISPGETVGYWDAVPYGWTVPAGSTGVVESTINLVNHPTIPAAYNDVVFEVTFQGETHDTLMAMMTTAGSVIQDEIQILTFTAATDGSQDGFFALSIDGEQTNDMSFSSTGDMDTLAQQIANALEGVLDAGADVTVNHLGSTGGVHQFEVIFGGTAGNQNQPAIVGATADDNPNYLGTELYRGNIGSSDTATGAQRGGSIAVDSPTWVYHTFASSGETQSQASTGMEPDGDFVVAWTQTELNLNGIPVTSNIYYRQSNENTDTAGPLTTDFLLPDGDRLEDGGEVTEPLNYIVVGFDEDMMREGTFSVTDPDNWVLLKDGVELVGGISQIYFGMNMGAELATTYGLDVPGSNKWEAVLVLDGNGATPGVTALENGHYEVVALNSLRDRSGNPLGRNGFQINGEQSSREFDINTPTGGETVVNDTTTADEYTFPGSTSPVDSDADGDTVVVWAADDSTTGTGLGIFAKLYDVTSWGDGTGDREGVYLPANEVVIQVTTEPTATNPNVAVDGDGDFVVTWSQIDAGGDWNVYYKRFDALGNAAPGQLTGGQIVNSETLNVQRLSDVAIDVDGDFVIVWQSLDQDGSGYGVYAQRYDPSGNPIGGINEVQLLEFVNDPVGSFALGFDVDGDGVINPVTEVTDDIDYEGSTFGIVDTVEQELADLGVSTSVTAISGTEIVITFTDVDGSRDQPQMTLENDNVSGDPGAAIQLSTIVQGAGGEFRVNDTTFNNQMFPSIDMSAEGDVVITWTSTGQDPDNPLSTDIYAKQFVSNEAIRGSSSSYSTSYTQYATALEPYGLTVDDFEPSIISVDSPANHEVQPGQGLDGVVELLMDWSGTFYAGSGVLLSTGQHILTAAHNVADDFGNLAATSVSTTFGLSSGDVTIESAEIYVHPDYTGFTDAVLTTGADLAIIVLEEEAPDEVERYDINRSGNEIGQVFEVYGYGDFGTGDVGDAFAGGVLRGGQNLFESSGTSLGFADMLWFDFDNGDAANDAFGVTLGYNDLGLGDNEVNTAGGDSGGPSFVGGVIVGITSGGSTWVTDIDGTTNSTYGEMSFNTRVSNYADWIDDIVESGGPEFQVNQTTELGQKWSDVAVDADGDFVITWTSYGQDGVGTGYGQGVGGQNGIYARRFNSAGSPVSNEFQVNAFADNNQQYSRVAMDADGDFVITWESFQDKPLPPYSGEVVDPDQADSYGIYAQRYVRTEDIDSTPFVGANGEIGTEMEINSTKPGDQRYPGVAVDDTGDIVIVWSGPGEDGLSGLDDDQGIFLQRYEKMLDDAGPTVTDVFNAVDTDDDLDTHGDKELEQVLDGAVLQSEVTQFVVNLGEVVNVEAFGTNSITNTNNWSLRLDGEVIVGGVADVEFITTETYPGPGSEPKDPGQDTGSAQSAKYEAIITFDGDPLESGNQSLGRGVYMLTLRDNVEDIWGNALDGDLNGISGGDYQLDFSILVGGVIGPEGPGEPDPEDADEPVNDNEIGDQEDPAVAVSGDGDYVVAWTTYGQSGDSSIEGNIVAQMFDSSGNTVGTQFIVNTYTDGNQHQPDVAMDTFGNFVITWAGEGLNDESGVFFRAFDALGAALDEQMAVNEFTQSIQDEPSVAIDATGDFVVSWTSYGQDGDLDGVYARTYNSAGIATTNEFRVNSTWTNRQDKSDVAMDSDGNFTVVWASDGQDGSSWGIYGQQFAKNGTPLGSEFSVNTYTNDKQIDPAIAMASNGDFVVAWSSFGQDSSGYGIFARLFNAGGTASNGKEFLVNQTTQHWQMSPSVGMDIDGDFVVSWSSFAQDNADADDYGIFARMFQASGADWLDPTDNLPLGEFRINATVVGDQVTPDIGVDADGDFVVAWVGPDSSGTGIYNRVVGVNISSSSSSSGSSGGSGGVSVEDAIGTHRDAAGAGYFIQDLNNNGGWDAGDTYHIFGDATDTPIVGDWNGDGVDDIGVHRAVGAAGYFILDSNGSGGWDAGDTYHIFGDATDTPIIGDWNGDGVDQIGVHRAVGAAGYFIQDFNGNGAWDGSDRYYIFGDATDTPIIGDWNGDGVDQIGVHRAVGAAGYFIQDLSGNGAWDGSDRYYIFGDASDTPLIGQWATGSPLLAAAEPVSAATEVAPLTSEALAPIVEAAIDNWSSAGSLTDGQIQALRQLDVRIADLPGARLGQALGNTITLDVNAAGLGWFVDATPSENEEFQPTASAGNLTAIDAQALDSIDLLTVVEHELGHALGLDDIRSSADQLMSETLQTGVRRTAGADEVDRVFAAW